MSGETEARSGALRVHPDVAESTFRGSVGSFHPYAVAGSGSMYSVPSRLGPESGQAAVLLRGAMEVAFQQWLVRPPNRAPEVWLMEVLRDRAVAWRLSGRLQAQPPPDRHPSTGQVHESLGSPEWIEIDSLTYDHREVLAFSEIARLPTADLAVGRGHDRGRRE